MIMKNLFYVLFAAIVLISCANGTKAKSNTPNEEKIQANHIEVLYFHGAQRCMTCRAIESNTVALLESLYANEKAKGLIRFKVIDVSKKENEQLAKKYEVSWSSLFINSWKDGKETVKNMTAFSFKNARTNPDNFKAGIQFEINKLLKQL